MNDYILFIPQIQEHLSQELNASLRMWYILRFDQRTNGGDGSFLVSDVISMFSKGKYKLYGRKRAKQVVNDGEGMFWRISQKADKSRLYIIGLEKVLRQLGINRIGKSIKIPIEDWLGTHKEFRASMYHAWLSNRKNPSSPISRQTIRERTGIPERTQYELEKTAQIDSEQNFAIGSGSSTQKAHKYKMQQAADKRVRGLFSIYDAEGKNGRKGQIYVAWYLPNSYQVRYSRAKYSRAGRINKRLSSPVEKLVQGPAHIRLFFQDAKEWLKHYKRATASYFRPPGSRLYVCNNA